MREGNDSNDVDGYWKVDQRITCENDQRLKSVRSDLCQTPSTGLPYPVTPTHHSIAWPVRVFCRYIRFLACIPVSLSLVLGHVLSPVRFLPRHSLLLIANYTSEPVWIASASSNFWTIPNPSLDFLWSVGLEDDELRQRGNSSRVVVVWIRFCNKSILLHNIHWLKPV